MLLLNRYHSSIIGPLKHNSRRHRVHRSARTGDHGHGREGHLEANHAGRKGTVGVIID